MSEVQTHQAKQASKETAWGFYRPRSGDKLDIGFFVKGLHFHWMYSKKQEYSQDRPWVPVRKDNLPPAFVKVLLDRRPGYFGDDGLVRYAELVLGFCREEDLIPFRQERKQENLEQLKSINRVPHDGKSMTVDAKFENDVNLGADAFKNL